MGAKSFLIIRVSSNCFFFNVNDNVSGDPRRDPAHLRAPCSAMPSHLVKGFTFFWDKKLIYSSIPNLVDFPAKGMTDLLFEKSINPVSWFHGPPVLFYVFKPFPTDYRTNSHNGADECATRFSSPCHSSRQGTPRFKNLFAPDF